MTITWAEHKSHRDHVVATTGQWVGLVDKNYEPVMDVAGIREADWPKVFSDTGSMSLELDGEIAEGVPNPAIDWLLRNDLSGLDSPGDADRLFHSAAWIVVERSSERRAYRVTELRPEGGRDYPDRITIVGVDAMEHLKHLPLWADPSNRSSVVQIQFADTQTGSAEDVTRKYLIRNLIGYFQPSLLGSMFSWTNDYDNPSKWSNFIAADHPVICSPISSGLASEHCVIDARWDNAWDLLKATWDAAGILVTADLWWPGDPQPFPAYTTLTAPTIVVDLSPRATTTGAAGLLGQGWRGIQRRINPDDNISSVTEFTSVQIPTADGRQPWVVFDLPDAPEMTIRKSTNWRFLVGGKAPKLVNDLIEVGIKTAFAAALSGIPFIGPAASALVTGAGDVVAAMSANRFLNLNEYRDQVRKAHHGRSAYISLAKAGEANSLDSLQKAWQAKTETGGGLSVAFEVDDPWPYDPDRDIQIGDTVGVRCWNTLWAAYISQHSWTSTPAEPIGNRISLGELSRLRDPEALLMANLENVRAVVGRIATAVST